jgi:methionyl-tRNA synthetase
MKKFYITTAIDYPNAEPHIGHAYQKVIADIIARWHRLKGEDVWFLLGTDEHGKKIQEAAEKAGKATRQFVDEMAKKFRDAWKSLNIEESRFIRTTDEDHQKLVQEAITKCDKAGDIYKGTYEGLYCTGCEAYYTEKELVEGDKCPIHKKPVEKLKEESYFFRLGKYQDFLLKLYKEHPEFILPNERRNEIINRVKEGLHDLSISRTSFRWGIPFPLDKKHIVYVWFDALFNYVSGAGKNMEYWPADVHLLGKDNNWFHSVYWPSFLKSAGYKLPKTVFVHGFLTFNGQKISKSLGNVISPKFLAEKYGADQLRYFMCKNFIFGQDGDFSEEALVEKINSELANDLGNLMMRVAVLTEKNFGGKIPNQGKLEAVDEKLIENSKIANEVDQLMMGYECNKALEKIWSFVRECNKYLNETEPWKIKEKDRIGTILYNLIESLRIIGVLLLPFIPETAEKILRQIGQKNGKLSDARFSSKTKGTVKKAEILFPKIEKKETDLIQKFDFRVAKVEKVENHPEADKLYVIKIDVGGEKRTLCAGLRNYLKPDEILGKKIVMIYNLKPAKLRGIESQGMLLAAEKNGKVRLLELEKSKPGEKVYVIEPRPEKQATIEDFSKIKFEVKNRKIFYKGQTLKTESEDVVVDIDDGAEVR